MTVVLQWLAGRAIAVYLVCLIGAVAYAIVALTARRRLLAAHFSLEREVIRQQVTRAWLMMGLFIALGVTIFLVSTYFVPTLPSPEIATETLVAGLTPRPTSTPTPSPTATAPLPTITPGPGAEATTAPPPATEEAVVATLAPTPTSAPTARPTAPPPQCPSPDVQIIAPVAGSTLNGIVEVWGTAKSNAFAYYKFEVQFLGAASPNFVAQFDAPVENGILGYWEITPQYPEGGPHQLRLVVVDIYGNTTNCIIPVYFRQ
ncbi:MAG: hypothetical protein JXB35_02680 [Anaerolineae bacterium]|nr:hypothetical protein [Anaerolineae bacterium]